MLILNILKTLYHLGIIRNVFTLVFFQKGYSIEKV
jgi:hypothetical protein